MTQAIVAEGLHVRRGESDVLTGVSFTLEQQKVLAFIGGNGAGKSTTLLALLGLLPLTKGRVTVLGEDVAKNAKSVRKNTGYLPETAALYDHLTALENAQYFLSLAEVKASNEDIFDTFKRVDLPEDAWTRRANALSKGMRQKVAIAMCILRRTRLILFDEPTSGLDPAAIDDFHTLIEALRTDGTSILMVTHDLFGACETADQIVLLQNGTVVGRFRPRQQRR
ncbi:MAG: ABC transporter ATP-binding protein [Pseudomonadota bacterium]